LTGDLIHKNGPAREHRNRPLITFSTEPEALRATFSAVSSTFGTSWLHCDHQRPSGGQSAARKPAGRVAIGLWFGEINWEILHHGRYRSMNFPYANMMSTQGDFFLWKRSGGSLGIQLPSVDLA